jgi:dimethylaniline monooxygenase (N-oxide forming)
MFQTHTSALVIGGGPAGLVSLKYLKEFTEWVDGETPILVEQEEEIGGTFRWRGYQNAELVSSKQLTCFSDFRWVLLFQFFYKLPGAGLGKAAGRERRRRRKQG